MTRVRLAGVAGLVIVLLAGTVALLMAEARPRSAPTTARPAAGVARISGHGRRLGSLSHGRIGFALTLRLHERRLDAYLSHVVPGSGSRPALTAAQFGARFGQSAARLAQLRSVLGELGIAVTRVYPQRTAMMVSARIDRLQRAFGLRFGRYATADGQAYFAAERTPRIPASLAPYISGLGDLSNAPVPSDDIPASGLTPKVTANAYDIIPLWNRGDNGRGQTIAVATPYGAINPADLRAFAGHYGNPEPNVEVKQINGGTAYDPRTGSDGEVDLDLQVISGVAPDARIIDYQGSQRRSLGHSLADIYNQVEQDGQAKIVSTSYGVCEAVLGAQDPGDQQLIDTSLKALEASGVTVFVASGDSGAYACLQVAQIQPTSNVPSVLSRLSVQTPASSPYAVSVGGTSIELRSNGTYLAEWAWSNPLQRAGGGGGLSDVETRPAWQQGPGVTTAAANPSGRRQVPDVAGPSDPASGFAVCQTNAGASGPVCAGGNGGTSAATPFWAASMLLVQQYAAQHGAGRLATCFAAPILYDLAASHQPVAPFHQIVFGNNGFYPSRAGWNYATGLGSPDVFNLAQDYASFLHSRSSRTCPF
jgi:subtilase family serine protease